MKRMIAVFWVLIFGLEFVDILILVSFSEGWTREGKVGIGGVDQYRRESV